MKQHLLGLAGCCYLRENVGHSGGSAIDIADLIHLSEFMFEGGPPPPCD